MATQGVTNKRFEDIGGGMDAYNPPSNINDNACVLIQNGITEGTSIRSVPGDVLYNTVDLGQTVFQISGAPAMLLSSNMRTIGLASYADWIIQFLTPTVSGSVGYNYVGIRTYNKRLGVERFTVTTMSLSRMKDMRISAITWKLTNVYIAAWSSGVGNSELHSWQLNETTGAVIPWGAGTSTVTLAYSGIKTVCFHESRLVIGGAPLQPGVVYYSRAASATNPEYAFDFSGTGSGATVVSTGGRISCIFKNNEKLYIGTDTEIYSAYFTDSGTMPATLFANSGILSHESHELVNQESFFFDGTDVRRLGYEANILAIKDSSISDPIRSLTRLLPEGSSFGQYKRDTVACSFMFPLYKLYVRSNFSDTNDYDFIYNVIDKSWSVATSQTKHSCTLSYNGRYLITNTGTLDLFLEGDYDGHNGQPKPFRILTKEYSFGDDVDYKRFTEYELYGRITDEVSATLNFYVDGAYKYGTTTDINRLKSPTLGSATIGASLIGSNSPQSTSSEFKIRIPLWLEGQTLQVEIIVNDVAYIRIDGQNYQYKFIKAHPIY